MPTIDVEGVGAFEVETGKRLVVTVNALLAKWKFSEVTREK